MCAWRRGAACLEREARGRGGGWVEWVMTSALLVGCRQGQRRRRGAAYTVCGVRAVRGETGEVKFTITPKGPWPWPRPASEWHAALTHPKINRRAEALQHGKDEFRTYIITTATMASPHVSCLWWPIDRFLLASCHVVNHFARAILFVAVKATCCVTYVRRYTSMTLHDTILSYGNAPRG
uniref:Uncharacterized protein n=1 Tax=Leersia perrieri TaxID=77586 RepID=A0A0D9V313_9ORYZ